MSTGLMVWWWMSEAETSCSQAWASYQANSLWHRTCHLVGCTSFNAQAEGHLSAVSSCVVTLRWSRREASSARCGDQSINFLAVRSHWHQATPVHSRRVFQMKVEDIRALLQPTAGWSRTTYSIHQNDCNLACFQLIHVQLAVKADPLCPIENVDAWFLSSACDCYNEWHVLMKLTLSSLTRSTYWLCSGYFQWSNNYTTTREDCMPGWDWPE